MRIIAIFFAEEISNVQNLAIRITPGAQELIHPAVVAGAVLDDIIRSRDGARIIRIAFIFMRIGIRIGNDR